MMNSKNSLYVHIPFCVQKCVYCDFLSFRGTGGEKAAYVSALIKEIEEKGGSDVKTVFFGGGTPTCLSESLIYDILNAVYKNFNVANDCETTIEANPETVSYESLKSLRQMGFNRLSFGIQSTDDAVLKRLNRRHDRKTAFRSYENAVRAGFSNINTDIMFALPNQTVDGFRDTLSDIAILNPTHISCYSLILAEGTPLYEEKWEQQPDEIDREMYYIARDFLHEKGYNQYEISNFAKPDCECRHNISYWDLSPYIGVGLNAASFTDNTRYRNTDSFSGYLSGDYGRYEVFPIMGDDLMREYMFLKLRMTEGINLSDFHDKFNVNVFDIFSNELYSLITDGLLKRQDDAIMLTNYGMDISNVAFSKFL